MKKILTIIDMQNDFVRNDGKLPVKGAESIIPTILKLIENVKDQSLMFTMDWHPLDSEEFKTWPKHCVQGTIGANIVSEFNGVTNNFEVLKDNINAFTNHTTAEIIKDIDEVYVCGVATDYCVKEFCIGAVALGKTVYLIVDAIAGVDEIPGVPKSKGKIVFDVMDLAYKCVIPIYASDVKF